MNEQPGRDALGREVRAARIRKYRTVTKAHQAAGMSRGAWEAVEKGQPVKGFTLAAVEQALDWPQGHADKLLTGEAIGPPLSDYSAADLERLRGEIGAANVDSALRQELLEVIERRTG